MSLATGGRAIGATSTRSSSASRAKRKASSMRTMPTCSPAGPTSRTSGTRIRSLIRGSVLICPPVGSGELTNQAAQNPQLETKQLRVSAHAKTPKSRKDGATPSSQTNPTTVLVDAVRVGDQVSTCGFSARLNRSQSRYHRRPDRPHEATSRPSLERSGPKDLFRLGHQLSDGIGDDPAERPLRQHQQA